MIREKLERLQEHPVLTRSLPGRGPHTYREVAELGTAEARRREASRASFELVPECAQAIEIIRSLGLERAEAAVPILATLFMTSPLSGVRTASGHALLSIDSDGARRVLASALELDDDTGLATFFAVRAMIRVHGARVYDLLGPHLADDAIRAPGGERLAQRILRVFGPSALVFQSDRKGASRLWRWLSAKLRLRSRPKFRAEWYERAELVVRADERWIRRALELRRVRAFESYARPVLGAVSVRKLDAAMTRWPDPPRSHVLYAGSRDFASRYGAGDHEGVWHDLRALGPIEHQDLREEVTAVAALTMKRVRANVDRITERLRAAGYPFDHLRPAWSAPSPDTERAIARIEDAAKSPCPIVLRAFWTIVGAVNWQHADGDGFAPSWTGLPLAERDPLVIYGPRDAWECAREWLDELENAHPEVVGPLDLWLAPDYLHKANISGGSPYSIRWTSDVADPSFDAERHETTFIEYLRICFRNGGFSRVALPEADDRTRAFCEGLARDLEPF